VPPRPPPLQHMGKPGMQRKRRDRPPVGGDPVVGIQRAQVSQQVAGAGQRPLGRGCQERQGGAAPKRQFQRQRRQIGGFDLGRGEGGLGAILAACPGPVAGAGGDAPGPPRALRGLGTADPFGHEPRHAGARIEPRAARQPGIDDGADILDGQRGFGDGGGQNDLAPLGLGRDGGALSGEGQGAEKRTQAAVGRQALGQQGLGAADLALAGQEGQDAAVGFGHGPGDQLGHGGLDSSVARKGLVEIAGFDRKAAPVRGEHRRVLHQGGDGGGVQRGGHDQQQQVGAQRGARFKGKRQP